MLLRATWERFQYSIGNNLAHFANIRGKVREVNYFRGATVVDTDMFENPFSSAPYIFGDGFRLSHGRYYTDHVFVHEYGHTIQSKYLGPLYLPLVAPASMKSVLLRDENIGTHQNRWFEALASRYGGRYFDKHYGSGASGYIAGSANYFDLNSYRTGARTIYNNPRGGRNFRPDTAFDGIEQFHWTDPYLYTNLPFWILLLWGHYR